MRVRTPAVHWGSNACANTSGSLGIIGAGTGNDFAGALGLPSLAAGRNVPKAVDAALGVSAPVDLLHVASTAAVREALDSSDGLTADSRFATSVATFGFSAVVNERAERMRFPRGPSRYTVATLLEAARLRSTMIELELDDRRVTCEATLVALANTARFGGGMRIAPEADPHDGLVDVVVIGAVGRATLLRVLPKAFSGRHIEHPAVTVHRAARVRVITSEPMAVRADGEPVTVTPATFTVAPAALAVAGVVAGFTDS